MGDCVANQGSEITLDAQTAFQDVLGADRLEEGPGDPGHVRDRHRDAAARVDLDVEELDAELQAGHRRPDRVGAEAVLVEVDEPRHGAGRAGGDGRRVRRDDEPGACRSVEVHPRPEDVRLEGRRPVVVEAARDAIGLVVFEVARERIDEGVREGQPERTGADERIVARALSGRH